MVFGILHHWTLRAAGEKGGGQDSWKHLQEDAETAQNWHLPEPVSACGHYLNLCREWRLTGLPVFFSDHAGQLFFFHT